jgi:tol-pal system protein YbgF
MNKGLRACLGAVALAKAAGLGLALVMLTASSAGAQSRREMQMMADIRMLQEQTQQLQQQLLSAVEQLSTTLKAINSRVDEQAAATRKSFADQKLAVDQFGTDLRIVRERIDENTVRITSLSQEIEALRLAIPQFPVLPTPPPLDPSGAVAPAAGVPPAGGVMTPPTAAPPVTLAPGMSPQRLFDTAMADFTVGQWALCIEGFETYLRGFGRTDLADDAQFYIGECRQRDNKPTEAVDAYNRVISNYPKGDRVPDAFYKRGLVFSEMGQTDRARESFEILMKQFPETDLARLAKQQVDRLNRGKPKA